MNIVLEDPCGHQFLYDYKKSKLSFQKQTLSVKANIVWEKLKNYIQTKYEAKRLLQHRINELSIQST